MVNDIKELVDNADVIVVNNREQEYIDALLESESPASVIDLVRLPQSIRDRKNYYGINW
jgi:GDP-mannose 6-dehydrogenase